MGAPKRYVLVGTGARGLGMFAQPLLNDFPETAKLVGLVDSNAVRINSANKLMGTDLPGFTDFDQMLRELDPDGVVVASRDSTHADYVIRSLQANKRVYSEKPLCTTAEQCRAIHEAAQQSEAEGFVTHNVRYGAAMGKATLKELIAEGRVGRVQHIEYRENLDLSHGAAYFRRWHKHKQNSGGLLIHKASHHFDALNWMVGAKPTRLRAVGGTYFYGQAGPFHGVRCRDCEHAKQCDFHFDLAGDDRLRTLYQEAEQDDGYMRDGCLFDPTIDTEDHASVYYEYDSGVRVAYTLTAYASYEGEHIAVQGDKGRLELNTLTVRNAPELTELNAQGAPTELRQLMHYDFWNGSAERIELPEPTAGGHGGSDTALRHDFFEKPWDAPRPDRMASLDEAIQAVLIGAAANESIARGGEEVDVQALLHASADVAAK